MVGWLVGWLVNDRTRNQGSVIDHGKSGPKRHSPSLPRTDHQPSSQSSDCPSRRRPNGPAWGVGTSQILRPPARRGRAHSSRWCRPKPVTRKGMGVACTKFATSRTLRHMRRTLNVRADGLRASRHYCRPGVCTWGTANGSVRMIYDDIWSARHKQ